MEYILAHQNRLLHQEGGDLLLDSQQAKSYLQQAIELIAVDDRLQLARLAERPEQCQTLDLRGHLATLDEHAYPRIARAQQLVNWRHQHLYCGRCAGPLELESLEVALACKQCGARQYPRISPCMIVLIEDGDRILLAHNRSFTENRYSTLAGFVEAGETVESAVKREIREEVGVEVDQLRYFRSQAWPFPDSLMLGFFARYAGGEVVPDGVEITDARWFRAQELDEIILPPRFAISRQLINDWRERQS